MTTTGIRSVIPDREVQEIVRHHKMADESFPEPVLPVYTEMIYTYDEYLRRYFPRREPEYPDDPEQRGRMIGREIVEEVRRHLGSTRPQAGRVG